MNEVIRVENLVKSIHGKVAIDSINIHLEEGNSLAIYGESGSGKTLIFKMLESSIFPTSGKILLFGKNPFEYPKIKHFVGYLSQDYSHYPYFTVKGLLSFYHSFYRKTNKDIEEKYLDFFKIARAAKVSELSKRQHLGLSIIAALAHEPRLLIVDHFSRGLDEVLRLDLLEIFKDDIAKLKSSLLLFSPDIIELERLVRCIALLIDGKIAFLKEFSDYQLKYKKVNVFAEKELDIEDIPIGNIKKIEREGRMYSLVIDGNLNYITELLALEGFQILDVKDYTLREFLNDKKEGKIS